MCITTFTSEKNQTEWPVATSRLYRPSHRVSFVVTSSSMERKLTAEKIPLPAQKIQIRKIMLFTQAPQKRARNTQQAAAMAINSVATIRRRPNVQGSTHQTTFWK